MIIAISFLYLYFKMLSGVRFYKNGKDTIKVACVGDSVTYGYGTSIWPKNNYPFILESFLGDEYTVNNYGFCGYRVQRDVNKPYSSKSPYKKSLEFEPDIVIFMLGLNDSKPIKRKGEDKFRDIELLSSYKESKVILCTPATAFYNGKKRVDSPASTSNQRE